MAANMAQMGPNGQQMMIPRQLQPVVYQALLSTNQPGGWQATVPIQDRMGKAMNLVTNCILAAPGQEWQNAVRWGIEVERKAYLGSPDRQTYEQHIAVQVNEVGKKRQANAPDLQNQLTSDAARQSQLQAQQQQMIMNQMAKSMGQPVQQGLQHLQHQMQPSPIPQQSQQQMGMGMTNQAMLQNRLNQQPFGMTPQQQPRPSNSVPTDMNQLSPAERRTLQEVAQKLLNSTPEPQKAQQRTELMQKMNPQLLQEMQNAGRDPLLFVYQQKAFTNMQRQAQMRLMQQRTQGMPPNMDPAQAQAMLLQQQQRQMNQGMMGQLGQQPGMGDNQVFANMESIRNEQKAGLLAQQSGQVVVPASGPGRNTPQSMNGMSLQNMPNNLQQGQQQRPQQMTQQQQLQQQMAAQQARLQQQQQQQHQQQQGGARPMQQGGGLQGPATTSQSPGMSTLTAPMQQPPVPMTTMNGGQMNNAAMGQPLGDPRFNQGNRQAMQQNLLNHPMVKAMLNNLNPEQRQSVSNMPPEKIRELVTKWTEQQRAAMNGGTPGSKPPQMGGMQSMPGMPGQVAAGQMNPMAQFGMGNPVQQPQPGANNMPGNMQNVTDVRFNTAVNTPGARNIMDSMDIPPPVLAQLGQMPLNMPPDTKKWGQLKNWMAQTPNPITPALRNQLNNFQLQQFRALLDRKTMQNNGGQPGRPMPPGGQPPNALAQQLQNPQGMGMPPNIPMPPQLRQVTPAEIDNYRKTHANAANLPNEMIHTMLLKLKADTWAKKYYESQGINRPGPGPPKPQGPTSQPPTTQPGLSTGPVHQNPPQVVPQKQPSAMPNANMKKPVQPPQQTPRPAQTNPSPATAQKSLKRPNPDEANDVPSQGNAPAQASARPMSQADQRPMPQPTPEQLARMTPEQKAKYEQMTRSRQITLSPEDMNRLKAISAEEQKSLAQEQMQDIPMSLEERNETISKIQETVKNMSKIGRGLGRWYAITHDESRARMFFRTRMRLIRQFADGDKMTTLRDSFSIRSAELDTARNMMESMAKDLAAHFDIPKKQEAGQSAQGTPQQQQQPTPRATQVPLNPANLEKQNQALNKQHQRSASKSGPAPPAPTTSQPPVQFGAQHSPTGQPTPTYLDKPAVTRETLQLPASRKKARTGPQQQTSSPAVSTAGASPQIKVPSPEIKRLPELKAPKFVCTEADCEMYSTGFATEEARNAHVHEEHVKPLEDPFKFAQESLAFTLGLDSQGNVKAPAKSTEAPQLTAAPMSLSLSKQGQTPMSKPDFASTPMSRDASMRRQGSLSGGKAPENSSTPGKSIKTEETPKPADVKFLGKQEHELVSMPVEDPWAGSTIDPQSLFASFAPLEPMASGLVSDLSVYRSMTPNDTPESSKDSGASELNSDVSEGAQIDIDINWQPLEADLLLDMNNVNMDGFEYTLDSDPMGADNFQFPSWDESEFSKSFQLDGSLFSLDTTS